MGYFWPVWPIWAWGAAVLIHFFIQRGRRGELEERIEELETTRAGAVDVQDDELRRIERDLHDGAQARLVALGMNIGLAEQKLAADPKAARELLADAQRGAREALEELRISPAVSTRPCSPTAGSRLLWRPSPTAPPCGSKSRSPS
jgi:signal transduction histidine kinase